MSPAPAYLSPIDDEQINELQTLLGRKKLEKLLSLLAAELPERIAIMRYSHRNDNLKSLRSEVHYFGGMAANFGLQRVAIAAKDVENSPGGWELESSLERLETEAQHALASLTSVNDQDRKLGSQTHP